MTIPVARRICRHALEDLGIRNECREDIELALTEACANVLKHSGGDDQYEVRISVEDDVCVLRVIDTGRGFDSSSLAGDVSDSAESGRGIAMMKALVDQVRLESKPELGTVVHLEKRLSYDDGSVMRRLVGS